MEEDLKEITNKIQQFCLKYQCLLKTDIAKVLYIDNEISNATVVYKIETKE